MDRGDLDAQFPALERIDHVDASPGRPRAPMEDVSILRNSDAGGERGF